MRGGDALKEKCGSGYGPKTMYGGDARKRQCGAGRKGKRGLEERQK